MMIAIYRRIGQGDKKQEAKEPPERQGRLMLELQRVTSGEQRALCARPHAERMARGRVLFVTKQHQVQVPKPASHPSVTC